MPPRPGSVAAYPHRTPIIEPDPRDEGVSAVRHRRHQRRWGPKQGGIRQLPAAAAASSPPREGTVPSQVA